MFDNIWNALSALAVLAGTTAALAFIVGVIIFWRAMPDGIGLAEDDWFETLPARGRHLK